MNGILILGNQLFSTVFFPKLDSKKAKVFMREDLELCTHFKYHKQKIGFFLSAMRKYAEGLKDAGFQVRYDRLGQDSASFEAALADFIDKEKVDHLYLFEIEDKFFEARVLDTVARIKGLKVTQVASPMFLTTRAEFRTYLQGTKKPFMKTFYESQRKRLRILVNDKGKPDEGKWSFDEENRLRLPKDYRPPEIPNYVMDPIDAEVAKVVEKFFPDHPGQMADCWLPSDRKSAQTWLQDFLDQRLRNFGSYEDALSKDHPFINHSILTPFLNVGLLTPDEVVDQTLKSAQKQGIPINSLEGFIRQVIGWREFIRGIYQNFSDRQESTNFWGHGRKLKDSWYTGTTGIEPLDDVIRKTQKYAYAHHIERLMVVGSLMLLLQIHPHEAHRWFMEMFIDSSDWVMGPNVYGMAIFSDGGIFATKPYFCGSNYYKKMGSYKTGDWQDGVDGLYWGFIDRNREFFSKNPRLSMMVKTFDKMASEKKRRIQLAADDLREKLTG